jgi:predicted NBD/HSP70 family sugar kinase
MHRIFTATGPPDDAAVLAADVGGTRLRAAAILADGTVALRCERPTRFERGGDAVASAILARARAAVARALVGLMDLLNPERVVLGGGVILADPPSWFGAARRSPDRTGLVVHVTRVELVLPELGDDAALVGCRPFLQGASRRV